MGDTAPRISWKSARELLGTAPPTADDLPLTLQGEPLDSADKLQQFLGDLNAAHTAFDLHDDTKS